MKTNVNINEESIKAMKEFRQKQIKNNIRLHIIFFTIILLLNFGLIFFIIVYKSKISEIKSRTTNNSNSISSDKDIINKRNTEIEHKMVNIMANSYNGLYHFSFIFETKKEVDIIKNYIVEFYKDKNLNIDIDKINMNIKYQAAIDGDGFNNFKQNINYNFHTFIFIEAENNYKFGFYIEDVIIIDKKNKYVDKDNNCFIVSFQKEGLFKCIGKKNKIEIKKDNDGILVIGDGDIIIKNNFYQTNQKMGKINYPFKSFDVSTINKNIFTAEDGEFDIVNIEVFSFDFNM